MSFKYDFILDANVRFVGCCIHEFRLVNDLGISIGLQRFNDDVLLHVERILFKSKHSRSRSWSCVVRAVRAILIYATKLRANVIDIEINCMHLIEHGNGIRISIDIAI